MSYNEKSAWAMTALTAGATVATYLANREGLSAWFFEGDTLDMKFTGIAFLFVVASIVIHTIIGIVFREDASAGHDERDEKVMFKSGAMAGSFLGFAVMWGLWQFHVSGSGESMFVTCLFGLLIATTLNFVLQSVFYRRGV